ncbi:hypothetical protein RHSIM_Rhsim01G0097000 [Rhododendron simsii]|uniref:Uncharacterized protein n=1 Tax=Rhododendron simsii TaxID=118357 RepID=A0A834HUP8_RHOSS|nr:hypothetical protein RHSIM_Rhsim01G0097000 [Rhododendron simsii]
MLFYDDKSASERLKIIGDGEVVISVAHLDRLRAYNLEDMSQREINVPFEGLVGPLTLYGTPIRTMDSLTVLHGAHVLVDAAACSFSPKGFGSGSYCC